MRKINHYHVSRLANWLLSKALPDQLHEELIGDLKEAYHDRIISRGKAYAALMYWFDVLHLITAFGSFKRSSNSHNGIMLHNYIKIALRHLSRSKVYSAINIFGLSVGIACAMLIVLFTKDEISFDKFHTNSASIYRVVSEVRMPDGSIVAGLGQTSIPMGPRVAANITGIEKYVRLREAYMPIQVGDDVQSEAILAADTSFFSIFSFPLLKGDPKSVLRDRYSIVLGEGLAMKYFGNADPIGKTIQLKQFDQYNSYVVTGVSKLCPENSSIQFQAIIPMIVPSHLMDEWLNSGVYTFVTIAPGNDPVRLEQIMQELYEKEAKQAIETIRNLGYQEKFVTHFQPLRDIHLSALYRAEGNGVNNPSEMILSYILWAIAGFVMAIACINFINLTIARSVKRAKEIGVRKISGCRRNELIRQFIGEAFIFCSIAFIVALLLAQLALPYFNDLANKQLSLSYLLDIELIAGYVVLLIVTAILAGSYPAFVMSGYNPAAILYNRFKLKGKNYLQKGLVIFQFALATALIITCLTMYTQVDFLANKDLGYKDDNIVAVVKPGITADEVRAFKSELLKYPDIELVAANGGSGMDAKINNGTTFHFSYEAVDENFIQLMGLSLVKGRNFSKEFATDSSKAVIVNEKFVHDAGWNDPIGQELSMFPYTGDKVVVIGVVKDYHYQKPTQAIEPQLFIPHPDPTYNNPYNSVLVKIRPESTQAAIQTIEMSFKKIFPLTPFEYELLDDANARRYDSEQRWGKIVLLGATLTIFISGIGLFGLSLLISEKRFKEIAIRKVLGASPRRIVTLLSLDYVKLVAAAVFIAVPVSWYLVGMWLNRYPYRIDARPWLFVIPGLMVVTIAALTVAYQSFRSASVNPVEIIKND